MLNITQKKLSPLYGVEFRQSLKLDAKAKGKKPQCQKPTSYNCGKACINISKGCKNSPNDAIAKGRLNKLRDQAIAFVEAKEIDKVTATQKQIAEIEKLRGEKAKGLLAERAEKRATQTPVKVLTDETSKLADDWDNMPERYRAKLLTDSKLRIKVLDRKKYREGSFDDLMTLIKDPKEKEKFLNEVKKGTYRGLTDQETPKTPQKSSLDILRERYKDVTDEDIKKNIELLKKRAEKFSEQGRTQMSGGKRSTQKAVAGHGGWMLYNQANDLEELLEDRQRSKIKDQTPVKVTTEDLPKVAGQTPVSEAIETKQGVTVQKAVKLPKTESTTSKLAGDGTHKGVPRNAQEYYDAVRKNGNDITQEEAEEVIESIKYWTGAGYRPIREDQKAGKFNQDAENIDKFIKNSTPYKGEIYRGISFRSEEDVRKWAKEGEIIGNQSAHASWTSDLKEAEHFGKFGTQPVVIKAVNKTGASVKSLSQNSHESEVIVSKGAQHRVKSITKKDKYILIETEEVLPQSQQTPVSEAIETKQGVTTQKVGKQTKVSVPVETGGKVAVKAKAKKQQPVKLPDDFPPAPSSGTTQEKTTNLIGDGTHEGVPRNAKAYYDAMAEKGTPITEQEAEEIIRSVKAWTRSGYTVRENQKKGKFNQDAENIDKFIKSSTPYIGEIYRGISFMSEEEAMKWTMGQGGDGILDNQSAHASWTSEFKVAKTFGKFGTQQVIVKSVNKTGASVKSLSAFNRESEIVVSKGTQHKVKKVTKEKNYILVEVEEV